MSLNPETIKRHVLAVAAIVGVIASGFVWLFTTFALAEDVDERFSEHEKLIIAGEVRTAKGQYWDRVDDLDETRAEGRDTDDLEAEIDDLISFICRHEPTWPKCD